MDLTGKFPLLTDADSVYALKEYSELISAALLKFRPKYAEYTANSTVAGGQAPWDVGVLSKSVEIDNTFSTVQPTTLPGAVDITEKGLYLFQVVSAPQNGPGSSGIFLRRGTGTAASPTSVLGTGTTTGGTWEYSTSALAIVNPGQFVRCTNFQTNQTVVASTLRVLKVLAL